MKLRLTAPWLGAIAAVLFSCVDAFAQAPSIKVVQWNVQDGEQPGEISAIVGQRPDVVLIQEADRVAHLDAIVAALEANQRVDWDRRYINRTNTTTGSSFLAILSRFPLSGVKTTRLSAEGEIICGLTVAARAAIGATMLVGGRPLAVFSTRNHYYQGDCPAREQNRRFKRWANANYPNVTHLYGGDFNMLPGAIAYDVMTEESPSSIDVWAEAVREGTAAAFDGNPTFWTPTRNNRLDYLFYRNAATVLDATSAHIPPRNTALSDHRMMIATFTVGSAANTRTRDLLPTEDVLIRGGQHANTNFNDPSNYPYLATRASSNDELKRRALLKFDTTVANIPAGATIISARLIVTLQFSNAASRTISAFDVTESGWIERTVTWNNRTPTAAWMTPGATLGAVRATATAGTTVGAQVTFDLTSWVQRVVNGLQPGGSRWTRLALVDTATSGTSDTYKAFHSEESSVARDMKPRLVIVYR
jgi:endonuclease/exonuclease/phosphatase family metal-dependent hydrolase